MSALSVSDHVGGLRVFAPQPSDWTLRQAYEELVVREHRARGKAASTLRDHRTHVDRWEEYWRAAPQGEGGPQLLGGAAGGANHRIGNPMVQTIGRSDLRAWRDWLLVTLRPRRDVGRDKQEAVARNVNKHVGTVQKILGACVDEGLLESVPRLRPLDCAGANEPVALTQVEAGAVYRACDVATWPTRGALTQLRWRSAIVIWTTYGLRCQELTAFEADHEPLRWSNVRFDPGCPANGGRTVAPHGWLSYVPQKQRRKKPRPVVVPLTLPARRHLDALRRTAGGDDEPVLPVPRAGKGFYEQWHSIASAAAERCGRPALAALQISHLRETCVTWHRDWEQHPGISELITGHAPRSIQQRHYDVPYGRLVEHLGRCTWPEAWDDPLPVEASTRQLRLF